MANTTPLLSDSNLTESPSLSPPPLSLDDIIERCIGEFGWAQFMQAILVSFAWAVDAQQTFISVFTDAEPTWHCTHDQLGRVDSPCDSVAPISNVNCQLPKDSWSWDLPIHTSLISEWGLECASSFVKGLPSSSFFFGCLVGGLALSTLADSSLGRKNMLFLSCLMTALSSSLIFFSTNLWIYSALRFFNGFARATITSCALVLSTELVGKKWRGQVGVIGFFCFTLGFLSLPAIAFINKGSSWRNLYLWTSILTIFYCVLVRFFVHESPRWLFLQGRKEEAVSILKGITPNYHSVSSLTASFFDVSLEKETWNVDLYSTIKILLGRNWAFRRISAIMVAGFGIGMVYYGMPLGLGNLKFNLYLSVTFNALSELPASLITFFLVGNLNRRSSLFTFTIISGICSIMCVVLGKSWTILQIGLEISSFFSVCTAFNLTLIYTIELFPTCVRNSAISMVRQAIVFGGVFSPVLVAAGREKVFLPYGVFGLVIGFCGLFVLGLPETRGGTLCDTMDEEEHKEKAAAYNEVP